MGLASLVCVLSSMGFWRRWARYLHGRWPRIFPAKYFESLPASLEQESPQMEVLIDISQKLNEIAGGLPGTRS
jgi:hypothetical protein